MGNGAPRGQMPTKKASDARVPKNHVMFIPPTPILRKKRVTSKLKLKMQK